MAGLINWRPKDIKNLNNAIRRFNYRLNKELQRNSNAISYLPERATITDLRKRIQTRSDFNREINALNRISQKNALNPVKVGNETITQWEKYDNTLRLRSINRRRADAKKEILQNQEEVKSFTMGGIEENNLNPKKINYESPYLNYDKLRESLINQARDNYLEDRYDLYKENYLKAIQNQLGNAGRELYTYIQSVSARDLFIHYADDLIVRIGFIYSKLDGGLEGVAEAALDRWKLILER